MKKMGRATKRAAGSTLITAFALKSDILEEDLLRRGIASDEYLRRISPDLWRRCEAARHQANRETAEMNRRLRDAGLAPIRLRPSLSQRKQNLQRLERRNEAAIARFKAQREKFKWKSAGTQPASRPPEAKR